MNIRVLSLGLISMLCASTVIDAAIFNIHNKTRKTIYVRPIWNGRNRLHDRLEPGQQKRYNSYIWSVTAIHWLEQLEKTDDTKNDILQFKAFEAPVSLGFFNLGGSFDILSDGSYDYFFGVDGINDGVASPANGL